MSYLSSPQASPPQPAILQVDQLSKRFAHRHPALDCVSFEVMPQSFTAILGPSGAGKTTLLRCLLRLCPPDSGTIHLAGQDLQSAPPHLLQQLRSQVGFIAQDYNLVGRRTALENCLAGRLRDVPLWRCVVNDYPRPLLREGLIALERVGLSEFAFQRADRLSGGQQQRVAIARVLTQGARLILADEPISSLDPASAHQILSLLKSLCDHDGLTVLCNLHQVEFAQTYSDRILGMQHGRIVLDQPTQLVSPPDYQRIYSG